MGMKPVKKIAMKPKKLAMKPAMKPMKPMKAKVKSKIAKGKRARILVFKGSKEKTTGGLTKATLVKNKAGKIVAKSASARSKKTFASSALKRWSDATKQARKVMGLNGFVAIGGSSPEGKALYAKVKSILSS